MQVASFAGALAMGDHSVVRELARLLALVLVGCGGTPRVPQMEAGQPTSDAFAEEIESPDGWSDAAVDFLYAPFRLHMYSKQEGPPCVSSASQ